MRLSSLSRLAVHALLALLLLAAQGGAALHALRHAADAVDAASAPRLGKEGPPAAACEQCLAFAVFDGSLPAEKPALPPAAHEGQALDAAAHADAPREAPAAYRSRAPPRLG